NQQKDEEMLTKIKEFFRPRPKEELTLEQDYNELYESWENKQATIEALNYALGELQQRLERNLNNATIMVTSILLTCGGEVSVSKDAIDLAAGPPGLQFEVVNNDDGGVVIKLAESQEEESE